MLSTSQNPYQVQGYGFENKELEAEYLPRPVSARIESFLQKIQSTSYGRVLYEDFWERKGCTFVKDLVVLSAAGTHFPFPKIIRTTGCNPDEATGQSPCEITMQSENHNERIHSDVNVRGFGIRENGSLSRSISL